MPAVASLSMLLATTGCNKLKARDQLNKGVQAYKNARYEEAIDHFQTAVNLDPSLTMTHMYLATAYAQQVVPQLRLGGQQGAWRTCGGGLQGRAADRSE